MKKSGKQQVVTRLSDDARKGMNLGELNQFVQEAFNAGLDPRTKVLCRVGFTFNIQALEVQG
jgi:hypothetical protein